MKRYTNVLTTALIGILPGAFLTARAQELNVKVDELADVSSVSVASAATVASATLSPDRRRIAFVVPQGSRMAANIDGTVLPEQFDKFNDFRMGEGDIKRPSPFLFSPDGQRVAFGASRSGKAYVIVDGKLGPPMENPFLEVGKSILFSPDSKRLAYMIQAPGADGTPEKIDIGIKPSSQLMDAYRVVLDGVAGPPFAFIQEIQFSPDGAKFGYIGVAGNKSQLMVDAKEAGSCYKVSGLRFSADSKRLAYTCTQVNRQLAEQIDQRLIVDGKPDRKAYSKLKLFQWSKTGARYAYVGIDNQNRSDRPVREEVVIDGAIKTDIKGGISTVQRLMLGPDGTRYAYVADLMDGRGTRNVVVVDGKLSAEYARVGHTAFSEDGKHFAALVYAAAGEFLLFDGAESPMPVTSYQDKWFFLSAGQSGYAYPVKNGNARSISVESPAGQLSIELSPAETSFLDSIGPSLITFSPDGKLNTRRAGQAVSVNGKFMPEVGMGTFFHFGGGHEAKALYSPDSQHVAFVGLVGGKTSAPRLELFLDGVSVPGENIAHTAFHAPIFSPDSRHFAYATRAKVEKFVPNNSEPWRIILDGKKGPVVDRFLERYSSSLAFLPDGRLQVIAIAGGKLQRWLLDPGKTTLADWPANAPNLKADAEKGPTSASQPQTQTQTQSGKAEIDKAAKDPVGAAREKLRRGLGGLLGGSRPKP